MAVVPDDQIGTVQQEPLPGRAYPRFSDEVNPAAFGSGLGAGLEQASSDLSQVEEREAARQQRLQDKANEDADRVQLAGAITKLSATRDALLFGKDSNDPNAAFRQSGAALPTLQENYGSQFDAAAQEINSTLTPHQQAMFAERIASEKDSFNLQLARYGNEQSNREAAETFGNAKTQTIQSASNNYRDPNATPQAREDLFNAGMALATRGGKDAIEAYKASGYAHDLDQLHEGVIGAYLADGNVAGAERYLKSWGNDLSSGAVRETLQNRITAAQDRLEAKGKETARDAYMDALAGARGGIPGSSTLVSDAQLRLLRPQDWQRQREFLDKASAVGAQGKLYDSMTPAAIEADLKSRQDKISAQPGVANDLELQQMLQREAQRSLTQRYNDPRQFLTLNTNSPEIDFSQSIDDQSKVLLSRFNTLQDDSKRIGVAAAPLSKKEAATFAQMLDSQSSDGKLAMLAQYRANLGDERFKGLMQEVAPQSPVTAKATMLLPRNPAQAPAWYDARFDDQGNTARTIMQGQDILNPGRLQAKEEGKGGFKGGIELPADEKFRAEWNDQPGVNGGVFAGRPMEANTSYEAAKSYYAAMVAMSGKPSNELDTSLWSKSVAAVIGHTQNENGFTVPVPRGLDPAKFQTLIDAQSRALERQHGLRENALSGYGLQEIGGYGSGRYGFIDSTGMHKTIDGKWATIDLNQASRNGR